MKWKHKHENIDDKKKSHKWRPQHRRDFKNQSHITEYCKDNRLSNAVEQAIQLAWIKNKPIPYQYVDQRTIQREDRIPRSLQLIDSPKGYWDLDIGEVKMIDKKLCIKH